MSSFIVEKFGKAFVILDLISDKLTTLSTDQKIETLKIVIKALTTTLGEYESKKRYQEQIYKDFKNGKA